MLEHGEELVVGVTILMKAVGVEKAYIGIENNKPDAIAHLTTHRRKGYKGIEVVPLKVMYPQGGEKQLIAAVTGRQVPPPPALPDRRGRRGVQRLDDRVPSTRPCRSTSR